MTVDVSLVICTRNRAAVLRPALEALAAIKSSREWEAIIVDNASTDDTKQVILEFGGLQGRLRYLFGEEIGLGAARNVGWKAARGEIVSFTDDDCYVAPDFVDAVWDAFQRRNEDVLGGRILLYDPKDYPITIQTEEDPFTLPPKSFVPAGSLQGANLSFRRSALTAIGGFDPSFGSGTPFPCEDVDAVAAVVWKAGGLAGYDPAPVVYHHHRRRESDVPQLMEHYDRGRGAYYAKYILRMNSALTYLKAWREIAKEEQNKDRRHREIRAALSYVFRRRMRSRNVD